MNPIHNTSRATSKQINVYIRRHPFVLSSTESFTTSQRRAFLRDVYDYARSLGLDKKESKQQTVKAREMCGEDEYNTDVSALENEIDDSESILVRLRDSTRTKPTAVVIEGSRPLSLGRQDSRSSTSDGTTSQSQKRRRAGDGIGEKNGITSRSASARPQVTATNRSTNHITKGRRPQQVHDDNFDTVSRSFQRDRLPPMRSQQNLGSSSIERELILTTKPVLSYDPRDPERDSGSSETDADKKQLSSHSNSVTIASTPDFPATKPNPKNVDTNNQNFASPDVVTFSDDE